MTLPNGFRVRLADQLLTLGHGSVLVGGSPLTAMRLSPRAQGLLDRGGVVVRDTATAQLADRLLATNLGRPDLEPLPVASAGDITVVIPVRDRPAQLGRALAALTGLSCVVVDDASHDPAAVAAVAARHDATYLPLDHNVGPAAARDFGLSHVATPYVAFVDSDVQVTAADLRRLTRHFADPAVALVGPRVVGRSISTKPRWFERYDEAASSLTLGRTPASVRPGAAVAWLPAACLVARNSALGHGFDPTLRVGEDVDLVWRLVAAEQRVRYDPTVAALHETRPTVRAWLSRKFYYGTGSAILGARHGDAIAPAVLSPTFALAGAAILTRSRLAMPLCALALATGTRAVRRTLPETSGRTRTAIRISARGLGWAVRQEAALLLRHWWPAAILAAVLSPAARRAVVSSLVVDTAVFLAEHRQSGARPEPVFAFARRVDDLAYGAGLWCGAARARSPRCLSPRWVWPRLRRQVRRKPIPPTWPASARRRSILVAEQRDAAAR
jgi:mycofactocin system glycosyltransferase